ncbi:2-dehydropantoate 2-reductase [Usitatibacter rugosus]|uniref:2-dehydropantoate 2-reductase n=1 Tax=Usitatibacter rugosus TaxID=2732067 RepID=A0A6M4GQY2_9PROT|nr:2-dehydropantoate 2-reductase [Usitatibacter rugosus]QJR09188.1 2-dehydropantoate 2-reductase [Usitatibacter rugosus]
MRIAVVGVGAIGGIVAARLALAGKDVTVFARGENHAAIARGGLAITQMDGRREVARVHASERFEDAKGFDVVIVAVKSHQLPAVGSGVAAICNDDTAVVPMQNGLPFWYFHEHGGALAGSTVESVDPGGKCLGAIPARRVLGVVTFMAGERPGPGEVKHTGGEGLRLGELDGRSTQRLESVATELRNAGFKCPALEDIRNEVWLKLWGNAVFNPISALTHSTLADICNDPDARKLVTQGMMEISAVAAKLGVTFPMTIENRIDVAGRIGHHKTSMLQDVEAGNALEIDALTGAVVELGAKVGVPTPALEALYRAVKLLDRTVRSGNLSVRAERRGGLPG